MSASPLDDVKTVYNLLPAKKTNLRDEIEVFQLQLVSLSFYPLSKYDRQSKTVKKKKQSAVAFF